MICPRCKSKNIAKNLYGNLGFDVQDREYYQKRQDTELLLNITAKEWRNLLYELFTKLSVQNWKTQYDSYDVYAYYIF